jgi:hypothetical protein
MGELRELYRQLVFNFRAQSNNNFLIPSKFSQSSSSLHHFILAKARTHRQYSDYILPHFDISASCPSIIEDDESFMVKDAAKTVNNSLVLYIEDFPFGFLIAEQDAFEFLDVQPFGEVWKDLALETFAS